LEIKNGKAKNLNIKPMTKIDNSGKMKNQFKNIKLSKLHRFEFDKKKSLSEMIDFTWNDIVSHPNNQKQITSRPFWCIPKQCFLSLWAYVPIYFPFPFSFLQCLKAHFSPLFLLVITPVNAKKNTIIFMWMSTSYSSSTHSNPTKQYKI